MFESIMPYREEEASFLSGRIASRSFPHAILFAGPSYSGRLTLAMECARVLSCNEEGSDSCGCPSCKEFSSYGMSNVVAVGNRDHWTRIDAALELYRHLGTERSRVQLLKAIRIMLLQYHGALLGSAESKNSAIFNAASSVDEALLTIDWDDRGANARIAELVGGILKPLQNLMKKNQTLSIGQVRALQDWTVQTSFGNRNRFLILEGVEQSTEGARNSLLKLLEEPPAHTYIILISEHPSRLLPTILSRVQRHHVPPFSEEQKRRLLSELYHAEGSEFVSVEQFMLMNAGIPCASIKDAAISYAQACSISRSLRREELDRLTAELDEPVRLQYFLKEFEREVRQLFFNGNLNAKRASFLMNIASDALWRAMTYNQGGRLLVESLHYRLLEVS